MRFLLIPFGAVAFSLGVAVGGIHWSWMGQSISTKVAFWEMVGSWVSGISTVAAVVLSLYVMFKSAQDAKEKVHISFKVLPPLMGVRFSEPYIAELQVKNMKNLRAEIIGVHLEISGSRHREDIGFLKKMDTRNIIPFSLISRGEKWSFVFNFTDENRMKAVFDRLASSGSPTFRKGHFVIETSMQEHRMKIPRDFLARLKTLYDNREQ